LRSGVSHEEQNLYGSFRPTEQVWLAWERTREIASVLDAQVIVFQCPKSFLPTRESLRNLSKFFRRIDRDQRMLAWEPRGEDWSPELTKNVCAENNLIHCVTLLNPIQLTGMHCTGGSMAKRATDTGTPMTTWPTSKPN